ncbi:MAG: metallopeptidase family protein [Dehalococcoidales bacterium]
MDSERFQRLVARAVEELPQEFLAMLDNVDIVLEDHPTQAQIGEAQGGYTLLGLYEGVPRTERGAHYGLVPPDKITIFQKPIESISCSDDEIIAEINRVVKHEIAHHFGIDDTRLDQLENGT